MKGKAAIPNQKHGVYIWHASYNLISNNLISGNEQDGIHIKGFDPFALNIPLSQQNEILNNRIGAYNTTDYRMFIPNENGIVLDSTSMNQIRDNSIWGNNMSGIEMRYANDNEFVNNYIGSRYWTISGTHLHGFLMGFSDRNVIMGNRILQNRNGLFLIECNANEIIQILLSLANMVS